MKINCSSINQSIIKLNSLVNDYEYIFINLNNVLENVLNYWSDNDSKLYIEKITIEKRQINKNITELKDIISVYNYILKEYSNIGNDIFFDVNNIGYIYEYLDEYVDLINEIINLYSSISIKYSSIIVDQQNYFINLKNNIDFLRKVIENTVNRVNKIERQVNVKLNNINVDLVKVSDVYNLL